MELIGTFVLVLFIYWVIRFLIRMFAIRQIFFDQKKNSSRQGTQTTKTPSPGEKVELDELEKRRFDKDQGEYVDFEDIKDKS